VQHLAGGQCVSLCADAVVCRERPFREVRRDLASRARVPDHARTSLLAPCGVHGMRGERTRLLSCRGGAHGTRNPHPRRRSPFPRRGCPVRVRSESMFPALRDGETVGVVPLHPDGPAPGDLIALIGVDRRAWVHRVVGVGPVEILTRGDGNPTTDVPVPRTAIIGLVRRGEAIDRFIARSPGHAVVGTLMRWLTGEGVPATSRQSMVPASCGAPPDAGGCSADLAFDPPSTPLV